MLGFETNDDAAVYRISDTQAVLLTVDFFTPIVDDPYDFGRITAANSLSDIYAMGATPLVAMNLLAFSCALGAGVVREVLRGGADICAQAGVVIVGGHTIDDNEPKYGLSVMGMIHPDEVWLNRGARPGDVMVLTKPLGTGIWGTAIKQERVSAHEAHEASRSMATLNKTAMETARGLDVHACTDITGFGLAGHAHEMADASGVDACITLSTVPFLKRTHEFAKDGLCPGRTKDIISWIRPYLSFDSTYSADEQKLWLDLVCDPQTSGGLLLALSPDDADRYVERMDGSAVVVGSFSAGTGSLHLI
jgi:selenide,water dikinase